MQNPFDPTSCCLVRPNTQPREWIANSAKKTEPHNSIPNKFSPQMAAHHLCRRVALSSTTSQILRSSAFLHRYPYSNAAAAAHEKQREHTNGDDTFQNWVTLPPFMPHMDAPSIGKEIAGRKTMGKGEPITALKWVRRCCPHLPMSLVQKLFRLRQVSLSISSAHKVFVKMPEWNLLC